MFLSLSCLPISEGDSVKVQCDWRAGVRDHIGRGAPQLRIRHPCPDCSVIKGIVVTLLTEGRTKMKMQVLTPRSVSIFDDVSVPGHPPPLSSEYPALLFCRSVGMMIPVSECKNTQHCWGLEGIFRDRTGFAPGFTQLQPSSTPVWSLECVEILVSRTILAKDN